jgi:hypothetical protein
VAAQVSTTSLCQAQLQLKKAMQAEGTKRRTEIKTPVYAKGSKRTPGQRQSSVQVCCWQGRVCGMLKQLQ